MPVEGFVWEPKENILTNIEILRIAEIFSKMGIQKIRLTGGEPTLRPRLPELIRQLKAIQGIESLAMTTNGTTLHRKSAEYFDHGLDVLTVSLDSLDSEKFEKITRKNQFELVMKGIGTALNCGFREIKINVVVMQGVNETEILEFVDLTRELNVTVRFIEFMPFLGNCWSKASLYPYEKMLSDIKAKHVLNRIQTDSSAVGKDYYIPGHKGKIGFVTSMTETFCGDCDRVRLTCDGSIKPCLFSPSEVNLRDAIRCGADDVEISELIREAVKRKPKEHQPMIQLSTIQSRSMTQIGG